MPLVRVPVEAEPQFAGFRFGHGFEHSIPQPDRYTVVKGKAKRNASRATAAIGRALNELARELEEIHDAEGTLWRRKGAAGHKGDLSPSEIMQRVSAHAERVAPVMGIVREERVEQLRRALGPEMDGSHWADRRKLDVLQKLRRERTLCAPSAPMELDAEVLVDDSPAKLDEELFATRREQLLAQAGFELDPSLGPAALREQVARRLARRREQYGQEVPSSRERQDNRFAGAFSEGDETIRVFETDSSSEASTELMTPSKMNSRRISDVSLDRFGYDPYGRRLSSTEQLQTQQMQMQMQQMQQQVMLSPQEFFALQQQEQLMMQWQQQQQLQRQARSIDSTSSSGAPSPAQQQQPYGWGQPPPRLQRVPWRIHGPAAGPATLEQPPPPPPPRVGTTPVPGMFARFGGRQAVHNGPDTDEYRLLLSAPTEYANTLAATTEIATSYDGGTSVGGDGFEVMSRYYGGTGSAVSGGGGTYAGYGRGGRSTAMSEYQSEWGYSAHEMAPVGERYNRGDSEGKGSYGDYDVFEAGVGSSISSGAEGEMAALLLSGAGAGGEGGSRRAQPQQGRGGGFGGGKSNRR